MWKSEVSPFWRCSVCSTDDMHWSSCNASDCFRRAHTSLLSLSAAIIMLKTKWNWITGSALGINSMNLDWLKEHRVGWHLAWCMRVGRLPTQPSVIPKWRGTKNCLQMSDVVLSDKAKGIWNILQQSFLIIELYIMHRYTFKNYVLHLPYVNISSPRSVIVHRIHIPSFHHGIETNTVKLRGKRLGVKGQVKGNKQKSSLCSPAYA